MQRIETSEPEELLVMGARLSIVAHMGPGDDDTVLIRSAMPAEPRYIPLHAHADIETFYVLDGRLEIYLEDGQPGWRSVTAGLSLTIPANARHAVRNVSGAPVDSILATTGRIARFFHEIATPPGTIPRMPPSAEDIGRVLEAVEKYGYWMASPEQNSALSGQGAIVPAAT